MNKNDKTNFNEGLLNFIFIFTSVLLRYEYFGFNYYKQLDDYIQYHNYAAYNPHFFKFAIKIGLFAARPIAGSLDYLFWSKFWGNMFVALVIITALYSLSGVIIYNILRESLNLNFLFFVFFALFPINIEGTYWLSASSRIVCALFFVSISSYFCFKYTQKGGSFNLFLFSLFQLISFGFYEQAIPMSFAMIFVIILLCKDKKGLGKFISLTVFSVILYFGFTNLFKDSLLYNNKMQIVLPINRYYYNSLLPRILIQIKSVFFYAPINIIKNGFIRGLNIILYGHNLLFLLGLLLIIFLIIIITNRRVITCKKFNFNPSFFTGLFLSIAPLSVFMVSAEPWFSLRGYVMSGIGISIMASALFEVFLIPFNSFKRVFYTSIPAILSAVFIITGISEISDYRETYYNDNRVVNSLLSEISQYDANKEIAVLNIEPSYLNQQNYFHNEHIHGVTESDWALTGAIRAVGGSNNLPYVTPIKKGDIYPPYYRFNEYDLYFYMDENYKLIPLNKKENIDGTIVFYDSLSGSKIAEIIKTQDNKLSLLP